MRQLQELWWAEAAGNHVLPVDTRLLAARIKPDEIPNPTTGLKSITYHAGAGMGWYVQNGKLVFSYNFFTECTCIEATEPLAPGQ